MKPWRLGVICCTAVLVTGLVSATPAQAATATAAQTASTASAWATESGFRNSVAVLDTRTGQFAGAGDYNSTYASESVMKVFIATRLLVEGQMSGATAATAWKMITQSDDASASALYGKVGGDSILSWVESHYDLPFLGTPPPRAGWWGGTRITARGLVYFYAKVKADPAVWSWLGDAMHHGAQRGSDGTFQAFGIAAATGGAAFKSGWGQDYGDGSADFNSTGFVNGDRYAVAILADGPGQSYGAAISSALTRMAEILMPGGLMPSLGPTRPATVIATKAAPTVAPGARTRPSVASSVAPTVAPSVAPSVAPAPVPDVRVVVRRGAAGFVELWTVRTAARQ